MHRAKAWRIGKGGSAVRKVLAHFLARIVTIWVILTFVGTAKGALSESEFEEHLHVD